MKFLFKTIFVFIVIQMSTISYSQVVTNSTELNNAISSAGPGTTITLADGEWNNVFIDIDKEGTSSDPITITAQNPGAVLMTGNSRVYMEGSYLTVSGLVFEDPANLNTSGDNIKPVIELKRCNYCKVLNNKIDAYNGSESQKEMTFKWILADGQYNEIAYNSFLGKYGVGSIINDNRNSSEPDYLRIHHNYFADRTPINEVNEDNDQDAIRIGNSGTSLDNSNSEVYQNYFHNFFGEVEVISSKSGQNKFYNNTFRNYAGAMTLRHGNECEVYGNYFIAENNIFSAGIRVIGENHKIYNNYIEGVNSTKPDGSTSSATGGINVSNGRPNSAVNGYYQVKNTQVVNNTFVNCDYGLRIGTKVKSDLSLAPENLVVANNIMYNTSKNAYQIITSPTGSSIAEGNLTDLPMSDLSDDGLFYRLTEGSTPIDAGKGSYAFLSQDVLGGERDGMLDAGAEEFGSNGMNFPFDDMDIGVNIGFGAISEPTLSSAPTILTFGKYEETLTFEVISNVEWTITNDIPWLSLDKESGIGTQTISVTVEKNNTSDERTGEIAIDEVEGGSELSSLLSVVQLNTFIPSEIEIVSATSIGMQDKEGIVEENAYNDDNTNYWTGDPDTEPEVSITFDLSCEHVLTEIGINFWKADERTTTFSIAVAKDANGPYTTIIDSETSAESNVNVDTEQFFSLNNTLGRYVKFIGIGNSSSSNWTSIANVNIYGDVNCENITGTKNEPQLDHLIHIFPVPVTEGRLTISAGGEELKSIDIYNVSGQKVMTLNGGGANSMQLDVTNLDSGIYVVRLEGIGQSRFIIN